jgi:hypothetical protein
LLPGWRCRCDCCVQSIISQPHRTRGQAPVIPTALGDEAEACGPIGQCARRMIRCAVPRVPPTANGVAVVVRGDPGAPSSDTPEPVPSEATGREMTLTWIGRGPAEGPGGGRERQTERRQAAAPACARDRPTEMLGALVRLARRRRWCFHWVPPDARTASSALNKGRLRSISSSARA